jgi:hypothetical protein
LWAVTLGLTLALTGCQGQSSEDPDVTAATSRPTAEIRHDTDVLAQTFPALGAPVSASWITWDNADDKSSKLRLTWTDAVVQVTPETMGELLERGNAEDFGHQPAVQKVLEPELPPGPFLTGVELNLRFGAVRRSTRVFLDPPRDTVVLQSSIAGG